MLSDVLHPKEYLDFYKQNKHHNNFVQSAVPKSITIKNENSFSGMHTVFFLNFFLVTSYRETIYLKISFYLTCI